MYKSKGTPPSTKKGQKIHKKSPGLHFDTKDTNTTIAQRSGDRDAFAATGEKNPGRMKIMLNGSAIDRGFKQAGKAAKSMRSLKKSLIKRKK